MNSLSDAHTSDEVVKTAAASNDQRRELAICACRRFSLFMVLRLFIDLICLLCSSTLFDLNANERKTAVTHNG